MSERGIESFLSDEAPSVETDGTAAVETPAETGGAVAPEAPTDEAGQPRVPKGEPGAGQFASPAPTGGDATPAADAIEAPAAPAPERAQPGAPPTPAEAPLIPRTALLSERQKRQAAEERVRLLEAQLSQPRQPQPTAEPTPEEEVDFYDDPDKFLDRRLEAFGSRLLQQIETRQAAAKANKAEAAARARYADYDDSIVEFRRLASLDRSLVDQMAAADDPAEFAYRKGHCKLSG